jgi:DNA-binding response OmpR family regulator
MAAVARAAREVLTVREPGPDLAEFGISAAQLVVGRVALAPSERQLFVAGHRVHLSAREFEVLHVLVRCAGNVV